MKTPLKYKKNLENKVITKEMLGACIYSVSKRAKHMGEKQKEYLDRSRKDEEYYDWHNNELIYKSKKEEYFSMKEELLKLVEPTCIHEIDCKWRTCIYDYEDEFKNYSKEDIVDSSFYYKGMSGEKGIYIYVNKDTTRYYLYYDLGKYSFHVPIGLSILYKGKEIRKIKKLAPKSQPLNKLISLQFVNKVLELIRSGDYVFVE